MIAKADVKRVRGIEIGFDGADRFTVSVVSADGIRTDCASVATKAEAVAMQDDMMQEHDCQGWSTAEAATRE